MRTRWKRTSAWHERNRPNYERVKAQVRADMPDIFSDQHPLPLKLGTHDDLVAKYTGIFTAAEISAFLVFWTQRREYHASLIQHKERHGIDGSREILTREHAEGAARLMRVGDLIKRIEVLENALHECAKMHILGNQDGIDWEGLAREFNRRQQIAADALGLPRAVDACESGLGRNAPSLPNTAAEASHTDDGGKPDSPSALQPEPK